MTTQQPQRDQPKSPRSPYASRSLYVVPTRGVDRLAHAPPGRTLHLVDVENLMGGPQEGEGALRRASVEYREVAPVQAGDHVIVACNPHLAVAVHQVWAGARILLGYGPDGADRALLREVEDNRWIARRFDRVIVGSGDAIFADASTGLQRWGIAVGVASLESALSFRLLQRADFVRLLTDRVLMEVCA